MPIDFAKLAKPSVHVVPVAGGAFVLNRKRYAVDAPDGWHKVETSNNRARAVEEHFWMDAPKGSASGYTYNNELVFANADSARRKWGADLKAPLLFNTLETFAPARAVMWEDKRLYYCQPWYEDAKASEVKAAYDADQPIAGMKGVTPELQALYLFHSLQRAQIRAAIAAQEAAAKAAQEREEHERRLADVGYRLRHTLEMAGAELRNFSRSGNRLVVDWQIRGGTHRYNSVLDADTFRVIEAGYCMSGDDRRHTATSMVLTAGEYERRRLTYITRR